MKTIIYLLIFILSFIICQNLKIREGQGPMVGSILWPSSYKGTTKVLHKPIKVKEKTDVKRYVKTEVTEKKDARVDTDVKAEHWYEDKEDVDVKKDVDVVHRYPEIWNVASVRDCNNKKKIIWDNYNAASKLQIEVKNLIEWFNDITPAIKANEKNAKINSNNIKRHQNMISKASIAIVQELQAVPPGKGAVNALRAQDPQ